MTSRVVLLVLAYMACAGHARRVQANDAFNPAAAFNPAQPSIAKNTGSSTPQATPARSSVRMETKADLESLAAKLNPVVGYWDPLELADGDFYNPLQKGGDNGEVEFIEKEAAIGFLRHAEIKHGRVAMAAFIGYIIQENGLHWPGMLTGKLSYAQIAEAGSPPAQWDALPSASKLQILLFIAFLEFCGESTDILEKSGLKHYMRGGKPGAYPSIKGVAPHPIPLDLFDPFGLQKNMSPEAKEKGLLTEINNGRLAMLGIMGFVAEAKVPGAVPMLTNVVKPYGGEIMAPFSETDANLPLVGTMLRAVAREQSDVLGAANAILKANPWSER